MEFCRDDSRMLFTKKHISYVYIYIHITHRALTESNIFIVLLNMRTL